MNYNLELNSKPAPLNLVFNNIVFDSFKVNVIERYTRQIISEVRLCEVFVKVRSLDNQLIEKKDGSKKIRIKGENFLHYQELSKVLFSYEYKNKLINNKEADQNYVHFIIELIINNYDL